jgi:hypothetical protein
VNTEQITTNPRQASATLLFDYLFDGQTGYFNTFTGQQARFTNPNARANDLTRVVNKTWAFPGQIAEAVEYLQAESRRKRDAYFGVHLYEAYQPGRRLADNAVEWVRSLWVDGDGAEVPAEWPQPSAIVYSSAGREHFYWRLEESISAQYAVSLNRRMAVAMGADTGKAGLSTVLRAPGTHNYKREVPELVTLEVTGERHTSGAIDAVVPEETRHTPPLRRHRGTKRPPWISAEQDRQFDLIRWMNHYEVPYGREVMDGGGRKWRLLECPIAPPGKEHCDGVYVGQYDSGAPWFQCYHHHGQGFVWQDVRPIFQPECYVPWWVKAVAKNG